MTPGNSACCGVYGAGSKTDVRQIVAPASSSPGATLRARHAYGLPIRITNAGTREPWYLATTPLEPRPWLVRMRRATVIVELLLLAMTFALPARDLPLDHIAWLILLDAAVNAV